MRLRRRHRPISGDLLTGQGEELNEALKLIDYALERFVSRRFVSAAEVVDLLLDVRSAVVVDRAFAGLLEELEAL